MYSLTSRFNGAISIFSTALVVMSLMMAYLSYSSLLSFPKDYFDEYTQFHVTDMKLSSKRLRSYGGSSNKPKENAKFKFDLQLDLSPLVDFNCKQIFAYIYLQLDDDQTVDADSIFAQNEPLQTKAGTKTLGGNFGDAPNGESRLIIWDHIFTSHVAQIKQTGMTSKYSIWDFNPELAGRKGHFKLAYNIQPHVGPLMFGEIDLRESITLL